MIPLPKSETLSLLSLLDMIFGAQEFSREYRRLILPCDARAPLIFFYHIRICSSGVCSARIATSTFEGGGGGVGPFLEACVV